MSFLIKFWLALKKLHLYCLTCLQTYTPLYFSNRIFTIKITSNQTDFPSSETVTLFTMVKKPGNYFEPKLNHLIKF